MSATMAAGRAQARNPYPPTPTLTLLRAAAGLLDADSRRLVDALARDWPRALERRTAPLLRGADANVATLDRVLAAAGFADLEDLRRHASRELGAPLRAPDLRIAHDVGTAAVGRRDLEHVLHREQANLAETLRSLQASGALELAARALLASRRRWVFGDIKSRGYAQLLAADLGTALGNVSLVEPTSGAMLAAVGDATSRDSLTVFCFRRYSRNTVRIAEYFARIGATVVAVTDSDDSPVCPHATHILRVVTRSDTATHSPTAVTAIGHTVAALAAGGARHAGRRARVRERFAADLGWYDQDGSDT